VKCHFKTYRYEKQKLDFYWNSHNMGDQFSGFFHCTDDKPGKLHTIIGRVYCNDNTGLLGLLYIKTI
jgi:hypothetical protein